MHPECLHELNRVMDNPGEFEAIVVDNSPSPRLLLGVYPRGPLPTPERRTVKVLWCDRLEGWVKGKHQTINYPARWRVLWTLVGGPTLDAAAALAPKRAFDWEAAEHAFEAAYTKADPLWPGFDPHTLRAAEIFHVAPQAVTPAMRRVGKQANFTTHYHGKD